MSKKNFMKAMSAVSDENLDRYAQFEKKLGRKSARSRLIRITAIAACLAILIAAIPISMYFRDGGEPVIAHEYSVMNGEDVIYLTPNEFNSTRVVGKVSNEFRDAAASFAFELLKESNQADYEGDSLLVSPLSVMLALSMTANGAEGKTLKQFEDLFGGKMDIDELNEQLFNYTSTLTSTEKAKFNLANSVWVTSDPSFSVNRHFISRIEDTFDADIVAADMKNPETVSEINSWVKKETFDMIDKILEPDSLTEDSIMVLLNAIAFEAEWETEISEKSCFEDIFSGKNGDETVTFMRTMGDRYLEGDNEIGFLKNYSGGKYAFLALLPNEGIEIGDYVNSLTGEDFLDIYDKTSDVTAIAKMPQFTFDCNIKMNDILKEMGIGRAFNRSGAEFSGIGISENGNIYIDKVLHKTHIELDDKGTKAAAVTSVGVIKYTSAPHIVEVVHIDLDRPFVYGIVDTETGLPVFLGVCENIG